MRSTPVTTSTSTPSVSSVIEMPSGGAHGHNRTPASNAQANANASDSLSLTTAKLDYQEPLVLVVYALAGQGKSRLVGTANNLGLLPTEAKTIGSVVRAAQELGNETPIVPNQQLIRVADPALQTRMRKVCQLVDDPKFRKKGGEFSAPLLQEEMQRIAEGITIGQPAPECCQRHYFRWHVMRMKHFGYLMLNDPRVKTIAIDSFGTFCADISYANYGAVGVLSASDYGFAPREDMNKELREFLNAMNRKNLILTHHSKQVWENNQPTSKNKPESAWSGVDYFQTLEVELVTEEVKGAGNRVERVRYKAICRDCQANPRLIGQVLAEDTAITFAGMAQRVFPDSDPAHWE